MNETEKPYRQSKLNGKCVDSCNECIVEESRNHGIAEFIRMAAEIVGLAQVTNVNTPLLTCQNKIISKAKEIEEDKR